jgi:hypothetical protein
MGGHAETPDTWHVNPFEQSLSWEHVVSARAAPGRTKAAPAINAAMDVRTDGRRVAAREMLWVNMGKVAPVTRCIRPVRESRPGSPRVTLPLIARSRPSLFPANGPISRSGHRAKLCYLAGSPDRRAMARCRGQRTQVTDVGIPSLAVLLPRAGDVASLSSARSDPTPTLAREWAAPSRTCSSERCPSPTPQSPSPRCPQG